MVLNAGGVYVSGSLSVLMGDGVKCWVFLWEFKTLITLDHASSKTVFKWAMAARK